jgi:hypothetical protein
MEDNAESMLVPIGATKIQQRCDVHGIPVSKYRIKAPTQLFDFMV